MKDFLRVEMHAQIWECHQAFLLDFENQWVWLTRGRELAWVSSDRGIEGEDKYRGDQDKPIVEAGAFNKYKLNPLTRNNWRASLVNVQFLLTPEIAIMLVEHPICDGWVPARQPGSGKAKGIKSLC